MKYFVVNRNNLDSIEQIDSESENAMFVWTEDGKKYSRFGSTVFLFDKKANAEKLANQFLDEEIERAENTLNRARNKKSKLKAK